MFFKQVWRNAAKNRKNNGLFFGSLIIAIVAFYTLLSLEEQDVMRFLSTIESDAVRKLFILIPLVYAISLFFVFFMVYFACKYQVDSRRKEFGMYLMLGMKRRRLFLMLFCETLWNSLISLLIGLPVALFLTEGLSLATAKIVGIGLLGHKISFSPEALILTICGYILVQLLSMFMICVPFGTVEPARLLHIDISKKQSPFSKKANYIFFILGILFLIIAYYLGITQLQYFYFLTVVFLFVFGIAGTFFFYRGLGGFIGGRMRRKSMNSVGLTVFTGRQMQEQVLGQHKALAVASLLLLLALSCISFGISIGTERAADSRSADFSIKGSEEEIEAVLSMEEMRGKFAQVYPVHLSFSNTEFQMDEIINALRAVPDTENIIENMHIDYILSETTYNHLLEAIGKEPLHMPQQMVALYSSMKASSFYEKLEDALKQNISIGVNGSEYQLLPDLYHDNIVADRAITLYAALIVPDSLYNELALNQEEEQFCWNLHLSKSMTDELGLLQAIQEMDSYLSPTGLEYESFLGGIGRNLFYTVGTSYLTIYLGILFLLIANTVIGLKYLIWQRQNKRRYITLLMLGTDTPSLCVSVKKQIQLFFSLAMAVAACNSLFALVSLLVSFGQRLTGELLGSTALLAIIALIAFLLTEVVYIAIIKRTACREIAALEITDRG